MQEEGVDKFWVGVGASRFEFRMGREVPRRADCGSGATSAGLQLRGVSMPLVVSESLRTTLDQRRLGSNDRVQS